MIKIKSVFCFLLLITTAISAQDATENAAVLPTPGISTPSGCSAELNGYRPKIYIANFYVTYGKKDMGRLIGDYIARRFEADGRFDIISREEIEDEMRPLFKKKLPADKYLQTTVELAAAKNADCVVFGRISKTRSKKVTFLVRMASVQTGENLRSIDTEVDRKEALGFLESVGDSVVAYFQTAQAPAPIVAAEPVDTTKKHSGLYLNFTGGGGYLDISASQGSNSIGIGGVGGNFGGKIGIGVGGTLVLFGAADFFTALSPTARISNGTSSVSGTLTDTSLSTSMFGGGLTLYTPSNFFISGTVGATSSTITYGSGSTKYSESTDVGLGINASVGMEWPVSKDWGLGVALVGHYGQVTANNVTWTQMYAGLAVTASYN